MRKGKKVHYVANKKTLFEFEDIDEWKKKQKKSYY